MRIIRILVAEDTKVARDILVEGIEEYSQANLSGKNEIEIVKAESYSKALQKIIESGTDNNYFDIFFADIDFTEDGKGGKRDSGFELIERAFEVCPITAIVTHSGQFHAKDLWDKYEDLKQNGLIVRTMDKSHGEGGSQKWLNENLEKIVTEINEQAFLKDLWLNHKLILNNLNLNKIKICSDPFRELSIKEEIASNFETITMLLLKRKNFNADIILFRLILQLYHRSLEVFIAGDKTEEEIVKISDSNKEAAFKWVADFGKPANDREFTSRQSFLRKLAAFTIDEKFKFGYILNIYRNRSVHPNKEFRPEIIHLLFANLTLAIFMSENKGEIKYQSIRDFYAKHAINFNWIAKKDFDKLIDFLKL
jgi:CheY-like chemotaxis protein